MRSRAKEDFLIGKIQLVFYSMIFSLARPGRQARQAHAHTHAASINIDNALALSHIEEAAVDS